jgi:hypothetical protein
VDVTTDEGARLLESFVWAGQAERSTACAGRSTSCERARRCCARRHRQELPGVLTGPADDRLPDRRLRIPRRCDGALGAGDALRAGPADRVRVGRRRGAATSRPGACGSSVRTTSASSSATRTSTAPGSTTRCDHVAHNPKLKLIRRLLESRRQREKEGLFVCEGEDLVLAADDAGVDPVELLVSGEDVAPELVAPLSTLAHPPRVLGIYRRSALPRGSVPLTLALWHVGDPATSARCCAPPTRSARASRSRRVAPIRPGRRR